MIQLNELRIKNFVSTPDGIKQIEYFVKDICNFENREAWDCGVIKPIPLTEEWLLKFGFRWSIPHQAHYKKGFKYVIDFYPSHPQFSKQVCFVNYKHRTGDNLICVQYAHQLQNLYFSLTGEELTLKQA